MSSFDTGSEVVAPATWKKSASDSETMLRSNAERRGSSSEISSKIVCSSGGSVLGTAEVLIGKQCACARVICSGLVVAELCLSSVRALLVGLAGGIGEVDEVPASNANDS